MSQKEVKVNSYLHSIPILLKGYSIPLVCSLALLLICGSLFVVDLGFGFDNNLAYADEVDEEVGDGVSDEADDSFGGFGRDDIVLSPSDQAAGIDLQAASATIKIDNPILSATVAPGGIGYLATSVTYSAVDATSYTLQVTYASGKTGLTNGSTTLSGAGGKTGTVMKNTNSNLWGFSWTTSTDTNYDALTYYTVPPYNTRGTGLDSGRLETGATSIGSTTKKIVFAARFASSNNELGEYKTQVLLSLVATPKNTATSTASMTEVL